MDVVLALLTQLHDCDIGKCLFGTNELVTRFQHRKMSEPWKYFAFRPKGICNITFILVCLQPSVSVGRLVTGVLLTVLRTWRMKTDASDKFYLVHSDCVPFIVNNCLFFFWKFSCLYTAEWIVGQKHQDGCFPMWRWFSSFSHSTVWLAALLHYKGRL